MRHVAAKDPGQQMGRQPRRGRVQREVLVRKAEAQELPTERRAAEQQAMGAVAFQQLIGGLVPQGRAPGGSRLWVVLGRGWHVDTLRGRCWRR